MPRANRERLILDVAGQVFARGGYHAAAMDEIAELAGVSKPMLYAYFGSKEGLYVAYIDRTGRELLERLMQPRTRGDDPAQRLRSRIEEFLSFVEEHRDGWIVLFQEMASSRPIAEQVAVLRTQIADAVRRLLESGAPLECSLADPAADAIAHAVVGAGESFANWWLEHPDISRNQVAEWYVAVVQASLTAMGRATRTLTETGA